MAMVATGTAATALASRRQLPKAIPLTLGYFTTMEALQAGGYWVAGACGTTGNQLITALSYLHIVFQPFFINAFVMQFLPDKVSNRLRRSVYWLCAASAAFMLIQLAPLDWAGRCRLGQPLCGNELCLRPGSWHIAWDIPYNGLTVGFDDLIGLRIAFPTYVLTVFVLPVLYGAWRFTLFHALVGPILAYQLTNNLNEMPAVWCLFSIGIILVGLVPWLMRQLECDNWILWPQSWTASAAR